MQRSWVLALLWAVAACSTDTDLTDRPLFDNGVHVFEAQVIDGLTGAAVEGATVNVQVGRHFLDANVDAGFFTVYGIPYGSFRVNATASGYQTFHALMSFNNGSPNASLRRGDPYVYYFRNIVMYPEGTVPQGIVVSVYNGSDGAPVAGATVVATLTDVGAGVPADNRLLPNVGLVPKTISAKSGPDGKVSLQAANLVLGGEYSIDVFGALDAEGVFLVPEENLQVTVGSDVQEVLAFLRRPQLFPVAIKANNEDGAQTSNLQITFPYRIDVCSNPASHTWSNRSGSTDGDGVSAQPASTNPVSYTLTSDDTVLTLNYAVDPVTDDVGDDLVVRFLNVAVRPRGASDSSCVALSFVSLRDEGNVSPDIRVRDVP